MLTLVLLISYLFSAGVVDSQAQFSRMSQRRRNIFGVKGSSKNFVSGKIFCAPATKGTLRRNYFGNIGTNSRRGNSNFDLRIDIEDSSACYGEAKSLCGKNNNYKL